jgi:hypothetical protein
LVAIGTMLGLGMTLMAQPTQFRERAVDAFEDNRARWVPGTDIPMSAFDQSARFAPMPH